MSSNEPRANAEGMMGPYGQRYSWAYWVCVIGAGVLILLDIVGVTDNEASFTNVGALVLIVIAIFIRPGGVRGPRHGP